MLLDNINAAPPDVMERLNSLFEDSPSLALYEQGSSSVMLSKADGSIHPSFCLFATADPSRVSGHKLSRALTNRVIKVCLLPVDSSLTPANADQHDLWHLLKHRFSGIPGGYELASLCVRFHAHMLGAAEAGQLQLLGGCQLTARSLLHAADAALQYMHTGSGCSPVAATAQALLHTYLPGVVSPKQQQAVLSTLSELVQAPDLQHSKYAEPPVAGDGVEAWQQQAQSLERHLAALEGTAAAAAWMLVPFVAPAPLAATYALEVRGWWWMVSSIGPCRELSGGELCLQLQSCQLLCLAKLSGHPGVMLHVGASSS